MSNILKVLLISLLLILGGLFLLYFYTFKYGLSNESSDWALFIDICNLAIMSVLTYLNIYLFYKLTTTIEDSTSERFLQTKIERSEQAILDLRISEYQKLKDLAFKLKYHPEDSSITETYNLFLHTLEDLQHSSLFSFEDNWSSSQITLLFKRFNNDPANYISNRTELINELNTCLRTIELLMFTSQLRDEELLNQIREHPGKFDPSIISVDNFFRNNEQHS